MKLVLLSLVLTYVSAEVTERPDGCVWGPSYWCSSLDHARDCGATKHCLDAVWSMQIIEQDSNEGCTYCQLVVTELKSLLSDKSTEDEITAAAAKACQLLPDPDWQDQCKGIVNQYADLLLEMLAKDMNPSQICAAVGFCKGFEDRVSPYGIQATDQAIATPNTTCQDCQRFFTDVQESITSKETLDSLLQLLNQSLCSQLGSFGDLCMNLLKDNLPTALNVLADQLDPNIVCRVFGFCTSDHFHVSSLLMPLKNVFQLPRKMPLQYRSSEECDACKDIMGQVVSEIRDKTVQEKIEDVLETDFCGALGGLSATCKQLVEQYFPLLLELLANELDPTTFCQYIQLCPVPTLYEIRPIVSEKAVSQQATSSALCEVCKFAVGELDTMLQDNATEKEVEGYLEQFCQKLSTATLVKECTDFVHQYGALYMYELAKKLQPDVVCTAIKLCTAKSLAEKRRLDDAVCDICVDVVQEVETLLGNMTAEELEADLLPVCDVIPIDQYKTMCVSYVKQYAPLVVDFLKTKPDPRLVCGLAGVCNSSVEMTNVSPAVLKTPKQTPVEAGPSEMCKICDTVLFAAKELLENKQTQEEILAAMEKVCDEFPSEAAMCKALIEAEGKAILEKLAAEVEPGQICKELGLCQSSKQLIKKPPTVVLSPLDTLPVEGVGKSKGQWECKVCDAAMYTLKLILGNRITEDSIAAGLEALCNKLPPEMQGQCDNMVMKYEADIIKYALQDLDTVCQELKLCPSLLNTVLQSAGIMSPYDTLPLVGLEEKKEPALTSPVTCETCNIVMKFVIKYVGDAKTEAEIESLLLEACDHVASILEGECKNLVNTYTKEIINFILLDFSPQKVCQELGLCTTTPIKTLPQPVHVKLLKEASLDHETNSVTCDVCKYAMGYLENMLKENKTEEAIKEALDKLCSYLPSSMEAQCTTFVNEYADEVVKLIAQGLPPAEVCKELKLCMTLEVGSWKADVHILPAGAVQPTAPKLSSDVNDIKCTVCEMVMKEVKDLLSKNSSEAEVKKALLEVCAKLSGELKTECDSFVNEYTDLVYKLIIQGVVPEQICKELKLCPSVIEGKLKGQVECVACEFVIQKLDEILSENATKAEVEAALDRVCSLLPATVGTECKSIVDTYGKVIIDLITHNVGPKLICTTIGLCSGSGKTMALLKAKGQTVQATKKDVKCDACEIVCHLAEVYLHQNKSEKEIEQLLDRACDVLPDTVTVQCRAEVKMYAPEIIKDLQSDMDPDQVCPALQLCPPKSSNDDTLFFKPVRQQEMLGARKCSWGPAYWCANPDNAKACNAVEHCKKHVWN